jgi:hypothetical protein
MTAKQKATWFNYVWQLGIAAVFTFCVLYLFKGTNQKDVLWALGVSSLASSAFIIFTSPKGKTAAERRVLVAYFINMALGAITHYCLRSMIGAGGMFIGNGFLIFSVFASIAVILSMLCMVFFDAKHPPAVGICLILVIDMKRYYIIAVIAISALVLAVLHLTLKRWLRDLH